MVKAANRNDMSTDNEKEPMPRREIIRPKRYDFGDSSESDDIVDVFSPNLQTYVPGKEAFKNKPPTPPRLLRKVSYSVKKPAVDAHSQPSTSYSIPVGRPLNNNTLEMFDTLSKEELIKENLGNN